MTVAGVLLCAGEASRFEGPLNKLIYPFDDSVVVARSLDALMQANMDFVIVVDGAIDVSSHLPKDVIHLSNPSWKEGMATSLMCAIDCAKDLSVSSVVVGLGDQPGILASAWNAVARTSECPMAVATYHGNRRNPVRLDSSIWDLLPRSGDEGARALFRAHPELVEEVDCLGDPQDIDTLEDLIKWNS